ncbi:hypothetical protein K502DRAFT_366513 [Neoconidiobolus thromboides FSU 785]|nr:hypothetical protein K502DRAFT_366513 [Neoconidiobolus thromboides FSU 785]
MEEVPYVKYIQDVVYPKLSIISATMACIVVLVMILFTIYDKSLVDRVSLRLQTVISCYDIWVHTAQIWKRQYQDGPSAMCTFIGWQYVFIPLFYAFLNFSIGANLQLIFLHGVYITKRIETLYWVIPIVLALIISIPPLALGKLGYSEFNGCYTTGEDENYGKMFDLYSYEVPMLICMGYLIIVVILVIRHLSQGANIIKKQGSVYTDNSSSKAVKSLRLLAYRVMLYPTVMIVTHLGFVTANTYYDLNTDPLDNLDVWNMICRGLTGTLNLIAFLCDPTIQSAFIKVYDRVINNKLFDSEDTNRYGFSRSMVESEYQSNGNILPGSLNSSGSSEGNIGVVMRSL